jgi:hypothetical protein
MELRDGIELANQRAKELQASLPKAVSARYDRRIHRVVILLDSKLGVTFSPHDAEGLENATPEMLNPIEISPSGFGIHFPRLDADLYLPALLEGFLGSKKWMASRLGSAGGQARSVAKTAAAQKNGLLGGRPKKATVLTLELKPQKVAARRAHATKRSTVKR